MPKSTASRWITLAHILRPQGRKGEVLADLLTDFPERFDTHPQVFLAPAAFDGTPGVSPLVNQNQARSFEVISFWLPVGRNNGRIVLHFSGIDSINAAELLSGLDVIIPESQRLELDDDSSYVSDLVGCTLYECSDPGNPSAVGIVTEVQFATTPDGTRRLDEAAPLLAVETSSGDEVLVPFVKNFLVSLDPAAKRIEMNLPAGLLDLNS